MGALRPAGPRRHPLLQNDQGDDFLAYFGFVAIAASPDRFQLRQRGLDSSGP